jgi:hypothetical protein
LYRQLGYAPVPVRPGTKAPCISEWTRWCSELPSPELIREWSKKYPDAGIAIATGPASGIVALDLDHDDGSHARVLAAAGPSPVGKQGARGPTYFYRYRGEPSQAFRRHGHTICEVLSDKRLVIIPPTIHPDTGKPYVWTTPERLLNRAPSSLPPLNSTAVAAPFEPERQASPRRQSPPRHARRSRQPQAARLAEALQHIPADDYHTWVRCGLALKAALGDEGFAVWEAWSATSPKFDARVMAAKWRSFEPTEITAGTLFHLAARHGWQRPRVQQQR